ncbi:MAG TPA: hypothetical protein PK109_00925 [Candidatus Paceibacterota bacterium]|nr:hypothetical protein [Candidatus Paceibacterota bacterium]
MREGEFNRLLRECNAPTQEWNIPAKMLWLAVKSGQTQIHPTEAGLNCLTKSLWTVVSYFSSNGKMYYLYEIERIFANGVSDYRPRFVQLPDREELLPVAFSESGKKDESDNALIRRAFWEEMRKRISWDRMVVELLRKLETHDSVAHKGLLTSTWGPVVSYMASPSEFASGSEIVTMDERKIITRLGWETEEEMRIRRAAALEKNPSIP